MSERPNNDLPSEWEFHDDRAAIVVEGREAFRKQAFLAALTGMLTRSVPEEPHCGGLRTQSARELIERKKRVLLEEAMELAEEAKAHADAAVLVMFPTDADSETKK